MAHLWIEGVNELISGLKQNDKLSLAMNKTRLDYVNNLWIISTWITHFMVDLLFLKLICINCNVPI